MLQSQHRVPCLLGVGRGWRARQEEKTGVNVVDAEDFVEPRLGLGCPTRDLRAVAIGFINPAPILILGAANI
jgi:hypothetical protein